MWSLEPNPLFFICIIVIFFIGWLLGTFITARLKNRSLAKERERAEDDKKEYGKKEFKMGRNATRLEHEQAYSSLINALVDGGEKEFNLEPGNAAIVSRVYKAIQKLIEKAKNSPA